MELIPILSMIILVATVCTLILVGGAYILYKIQEKRADLFISTKQGSGKVVFVEPEDFGGRKLLIKKVEEVPALTKDSKPVNESISKQNMFDKSFQESERKKIKRKPTEPKYVKFSPEDFMQTDDERTSGVISWR